MLTWRVFYSVFVQRRLVVPQVEHEFEGTPPTFPRQGGWSWYRLARGMEKRRSMLLWNFFEQHKPEWLDELDFLYHYTSLDVLCTFLDSPQSDFYCTHFKALNDGKEMTAGVDFVVTWLREKLKWEEETCFLFKAVYDSLINGDGIISPWVMSFSRAFDSLSQWVAYTDSRRGGVAVGIRRAELLSAIERFPGCYSKTVAKGGEKGKDTGFKLKLLPCLYTGHDKELIGKLVEEMLTPHLEVFKHIREGVSQRSRSDWNTAISAVLEFSSIIKDESFSHEQEERLLLFPMTHSCLDCEILGGKPRWRTYISETRKEGIMSEIYRGLRGMIRKILISPHGDRQVLHTAVRVLLDKYGMTFCELVDSQSPYNGR